MPYGQKNWRTDVTIEGIPGQIGGEAAAKWEGAGADSDSAIYQRATGAVQLGGTTTREDGTATWLYDERMHAQWKLIELAGVRKSRVRVTRTPFADDGTPFAGGGFTMTGRVKGCKLPEGEAGSNDAGEATISFSMDAELA